MPESQGSSSGNKSNEIQVQLTSQGYMNNMQKFVLQSLIQSIAEKNDYDSAALGRQGGSIVFNNQLENIKSDNDEYFKDMRRKTLIMTSQNKLNLAAAKQQNNVCNEI